MTCDLLSRRVLLKRAVALSMLAAMGRLISACAGLSNTQANPGTQLALCGDVIDLTISEQVFHVHEGAGRAMTFNGTIPGPIIHLKEGQRRFSASRTGWQNRQGVSVKPPPCPPTEWRPNADSICSGGAGVFVILHSKY